MKSNIEVDVEDVIDGLSLVEKVDLAKDMSRYYLNLEEMIEVARIVGYKDQDILKELDWDIIKQFILDNE